MIFEIQGKVPHMNITTGDSEVCKSRILRAYKDYKNIIHGVSAVVGILDSIVEGEYNQTEAIIAGLILDKGICGAILEWRCKATLLCVNGIDVLAFDEEILDNQDFDNETFYPDAGGQYVLRRMSKIHEEKAAATANSNRPGAGETSSKKSPKV